MTTPRRRDGEGTLPRQRADGRWFSDIRSTDDYGVTKRTRVYGKTAKEVQAKLKEVRKRLDDGLPPTDAKMTVGAFTSVWLATTLPNSARKATTKATLTTLANKHIVGTSFGAVRLDQLRPQRVEGWFVDLRTSGLSDASVSKLYNLLRSILATAVRDGVLGRNPTDAVDRPKVERKEAEFLTGAQIQLLKDAARGTRHGPLFEVMVMTGVRPGEALALRWDDVDFDRRLLHVDGTLARVNGQLVETAPKTAKSDRWLHVSDRLAAVLQARRKRQVEERLLAGSVWHQTGYIFTTEAGLPLDPRNALRAIKTAAKAAGLPTTIGLHSLRHSAASVMLTNGVPLTTVSEVLGHSTATITAAVYSHVAPEAARSALEVLDGAVGS